MPGSFEITALQASQIFQSDRQGSRPRLSAVPELVMKKSNKGAKKDESVQRQLKESPSFRSKFRISKKRLREIGRKGFERMEGLKDSDFGDFAE